MRVVKAGFRLLRNRLQIVSTTLQKGKSVEFVRIILHAGKLTERVQKSGRQIGAFRQVTSRRKGVGSLILGTYGPDGTLVYEGRVGSGISARVEGELLLKLARLSELKAPFGKSPSSEHRREVHWVRPELVARVEFLERTNDGLLRHTSFQGLRNDIAPSSVVHGQ